MKHDCLGVAVAGAVGLALAPLACAPEADESSPGALAEPSHAIAVLRPIGGSEARGLVTFARIEGGVRVVAAVDGLSPGRHGFHVHEYGDCSASDGTSAGGHFNPDGSPHGGPGDADRHVGDLGNISADSDGTARHDAVDPRIELGGPRSIIGRAVILHAGEDDQTSQPSGAAGARIACGVIGVAERR